MSDEIQVFAVLNFNKLWKGTVIRHKKSQKDYKIIKCLPFKINGVWTLAIEYEPVYQHDLKNFGRLWDEIYKDFEFEEGDQVKEAFSTMCLTCLRKLP